jgi:hypothetical protein
LAGSVKFCPCLPEQGARQSLHLAGVPLQLPPKSWEKQDPIVNPLTRHQNSSQIKSIQLIIFEAPYFNLPGELDWILTLHPPDSWQIYRHEASEDPGL